MKRVPLFDGATWSEIEHPWPWADGEDDSTREKRFGLEDAWVFGDVAGDCIRLLHAPDDRYLVYVDGFGRCDEVVASHVGAALDLAARWSVGFRSRDCDALHALATVALRAFEAWHDHPLEPEDSASGCRQCNRAWEDVRAERRRLRAQAQSRSRSGGD